MSDRPMAQRHEWPGQCGDQAVERAGETARVFWRGTPAHGWSWWAWDEQVGLELLRVVAERDEARQALQEMEDAHSEETGERCRAEDERDLAVKAAAEAGLVLEGIRLAVVYELAPEILAAIDQALELVHAVIEDGAPTGRQEDRERP